jgi:hypothetical protein
VIDDANTLPSITSVKTLTYDTAKFINRVAKYTAYKSNERRIKEHSFYLCFGLELLNVLMHYVIAL